MEDHEEKSHGSSAIYLVLAVVGVLAASYFCYLRQDRQTAYAGLEALFTGLAFAWLIHSIRLQSAELSLQRQEMALQRAQLAKQAEELAVLSEAQQEQNKLQLQAAEFERTMYLLNKFTWPTPGAWKTHGKPKDKSLRNVLNQDAASGEYGGKLYEAGGWYIQSAALLERDLIDGDLLFDITRSHTADFVDMLEMHGVQESDAEYELVRKKLVKQVLEPFRAFTKSE